MFGSVEDDVVLEEYMALLEQLCGHLRFLLDQWKVYQTSLDLSTASSHHTSVLHTGSQG